MISSRQRRQLLGIGLLALSVFTALSLIPAVLLGPPGVLFPAGNVMGVLGRLFARSRGPPSAPARWRCRCCSGSAAPWPLAGPRPRPGSAGWRCSSASWCSCRHLRRSSPQIRASSSWRCCRTARPDGWAGRWPCRSPRSSAVSARSSPSPHSSWHCPSGPSAGTPRAPHCAGGGSSAPPGRRRSRATSQSPGSRPWRPSRPSRRRCPAVVSPGPSRRWAPPVPLPWKRPAGSCRSCCDGRGERRGQCRCWRTRATRTRRNGRHCSSSASRPFRTRHRATPISTGSVRC
jgi:hypothetical protein